MSLVDAIGTLAAAISVLSLAPQVVKTWRTRSARDLSYLWLGAALAGTLLWVAYGTLKADWAVFVANVLVAALVVLLLGMKRIYERRK
jgi:MtN3 and saliva related transmembrane protein